VRRLESLARRILAAWWLGLRCTGMSVYACGDRSAGPSGAWGRPGALHPERLAAHIPPSPAERRLWAELG
jgi:Family of unknown function (DUF6059)